MTKKTKKGDAPGGREFIGLLPRNPTPKDIDDFVSLIIAHIEQAKAEEAKRRATTKRPRPRQGARSQSSPAPAAKRRR